MTNDLNKVIAFLLGLNCLAFFIVGKALLSACERSKKLAKPKQSGNPRETLEKFGLHDLSYFHYLDEPRPIVNITTHPWKINLPGNKSTLNVSDRRWPMIVMVKSAANHTDRRFGIRNSWASKELQTDLDLVTVFIVGKSKNRNIMSALQRESQKHGDIMLVDLEESYRNVGYKTEVGMKWVSDNFPDFWLYSCSDDDMFPNLTALHDVIKTMKLKERQRKTDLLGNETWSDEYELSSLPIHCGFEYTIGASPHRSPKSKFFLTKDDFPTQRYPPYCQGGWFTMPVKLVRAFSETSRKLPFFWIDDIWLTALVRIKYFIFEAPQWYTLDWNKETVGMWTENRGGIVRHLGNTANNLQTWRNISMQILKSVNRLQGE